MFFSFVSPDKIKIKDTHSSITKYNVSGVSKTSLRLIM